MQIYGDFEGCPSYIALGWDGNLMTPVGKRHGKQSPFFPSKKVCRRSSEVCLASRATIFRDVGSDLLNVCQIRSLQCERIA